MMMITVVTIVGARPQFIKSAPVSLALQAAGIREITVHTGQHYDAKMSDVFFRELNLLAPAYNLEVGSGSQAYQTGEGLKRIEDVLEKENPDMVLVYGDTNATLAGGLAAVKLHIPVAHVEAGLRSFNRRMPEEINRVLTDHLSTWLFTPTQTAVENLDHEGITQGVHRVGDVMLDAVDLFAGPAQALFGDALEGHGLSEKKYYLLTMHRAETTEAPDKVHALLNVLECLDAPVLFPMHPRVRPLVEGFVSEAGAPYRNIRCVDPLSYFEMLVLQKNARAVLTDSGGVQKEAAFLQVPCVTLREETEWVETVETGWNQLVGLSPEKLQAALSRLTSPAASLRALYGNGEARNRIAAILSGACAPV